MRKEKKRVLHKTAFDARTRVRSYGIYRGHGGNTGRARASGVSPRRAGEVAAAAAAARPNAHRQLVGRHVRRRAPVCPCVRAAA